MASAHMHFLQKIIKSGLIQLSKHMREVKIEFLKTFVYFIKKNPKHLTLKLYEFFDRCLY
jgi:hypothetical protein